MQSGPIKRFLPTRAMPMTKKNRSQTPRFCDVSSGVIWHIGSCGTLGKQMEKISWKTYILRMLTRTWDVYQNWAKTENGDYHIIILIHGIARWIQVDNVKAPLCSPLTASFCHFYMGDSLQWSVYLGTEIPQSVDIWSRSFPTEIWSMKTVTVSYIISTVFFLHSNLMIIHDLGDLWWCNVRESLLF